MNKFGKREEEDFETICDVIKKMVEQAPALVVARDQGTQVIPFKLFPFRTPIYQYIHDHSRLIGSTP